MVKILTVKCDRCGEVVEGHRLYITLFESDDDNIDNLPQVSHQGSVDLCTACSGEFAADFQKWLGEKPTEGWLGEKVEGDAE